MAKSFNKLLTKRKIGWATPKFTLVDKKEPTPLVEARIRPSRIFLVEWLALDKFSQVLYSSIMVFQFLYNKKSPISGYDATIARLCSTPSPD
jgi:hypothetical protein